NGHALGDDVKLLNGSAEGFFSVFSLALACGSATASQPRGLTEGDDDGASDEVGDQADEVLALAPAEGATRGYEEVSTGEVAEGCDDQGGSVAAEPDGGRDGSIQGDEGEGVTQERVEEPAGKHHHEKRSKRKAVGCGGDSHWIPALGFLVH